MAITLTSSGHLWLDQKKARAGLAWNSGQAQADSYGSQAFIYKK